MRVKEIKLYKFDELSEEAKEKAIEKLYDINVDDSYWYECTIDDAKEIGKLMGIDISNIYFSGFSSQGDGACFEGKYTYRKNSVKELKAYAPQDEVLHTIVKDLYKIQKSAFYRLYARVKHRGHYSHEYCTEIDVYNDENDEQETTKEQEDGLTEVLRDFMRWIYRTLQKEYEYQTSQESIIETIKANEYEFTEDGTLE